jgi:DNA-binding response OmpR family regulator
MSAEQRGDRKVRILVADDEPNIRLLYRSELEADGYVVNTASDGKEAVAKVESENPDLVVLDIRMPGIDGVEALARILDRDRTMPVILNSAYSDYEQNFMTWSADAYVVKSSDVSVLKQRIREVLKKRRGVEASGAGEAR